MKNLTPLISKDEVHEWCHALLKSPVMKTSYETQGMVFDVIDRYASLPRITFDYSDHALERSQFSSYYGTLARRAYDSQAISDLYYMHEMMHGNVANYQHNQSESLWIKRMSAEEAYVSVMTELVAYFELPELRSQVQFPGWVIWADRFLKDDVKIYEWKVDRMLRRNANLGANPSNMDLFKQDKELFITFAIERRENIMHSIAPESLDPQERAIYGYGLNNFAWSDIWRSVRTKVEDAMLSLQASSQVNRGMALDNHQAFLEREKRGGVFPFHEQAGAFKRVMDEFYAKNDARAMDTAKREVSEL